VNRGRLVRALRAALITIAAATPLAGQDLRVPGRVLGPDGGPVAGQTVVLHRVTSDGGTLLAEATADADGRFVLEAPGPVPDGAVFFVASRFEGQLYIGPMLRPPLAPDEDVVLEIGDPARALGGVGAPAARPPVVQPGSATGTPRRWLLLLAPLAGLIGVAVWAAGAAAGPPRERRLLIQIARLDNRHHDAGDTGDAADYEKRRRRLLDELDASA
jgi:hypothetical protein